MNRSPRRPNFLFIFADQLRPDALGALGTLAPLRTPTMDEIASGGVRFAHSYTPNPVCVPAREAVITGLWAHRFGCMENGGPRPGADVPTFPRLLHEIGYVTFSAGKQHFNPVRDARGYGRMELSEGQPAYRQDDDYLLTLLQGGYGHVTEPGGRRGSAYYLPQESPLPDELHITQWTAQRAAAFIRANRNRPFFCTAAFFKPHPPFDPPRSYWDRYPPESVSMSPSGGDDGSAADQYLAVQNHKKSMDAPDEIRVRAVRSAYFALVEQIDDAIGSLVQTLRDCGVLDNTVIIISADHGELLGDHQAWGKRSFYEPSVGVPLIVHWPDGLPGGLVRETPVSTIDLFPTIVAMAGQSVPRPVDGLNLLPLARDGTALDRRGVSAEYGSGRAFKLMWRWRDGAHEWKYVWLANGGREQLFDLSTDPYEVHNLAALDRVRCQQAHEALVDWCKATAFSDATAGDFGLVSYPFEPIPLGDVNDQRPAWPARDPDF
ncbi:MAG TPA: sulfatase-like hydrolase/transferase [Chloroflexota bacterium]|nr:sulfatase-like hydrolase/transferase [Chloroflexota bacterium]